VLVFEVYGTPQGYCRSSALLAQTNSAHVFDATRHVLWRYVEPLQVR
jgi:hypothetical protein